MDQKVQIYKIVTIRTKYNFDWKQRYRIYNN